jgi:serine/threonine protein kinase
MLKEEIYTLPIDNEMSGIKIKIVDFGIFGSSKGTCSEKSTAGSLKYMAPELLSGRTQSTPKIDVWSMGCMLYAMVTGDYPFNGNEREELKKEILTKVTKVRTKYN